jgi:sensor histidine kinase YesM
MITSLYASGISSQIQADSSHLCHIAVLVILVCSQLLNHMKNLVNTSKRYNKLELLVTFAVFALGLTFLITNGFEEEAGTLHVPYQYAFEKVNAPFDFNINFLIPQLIRLVFGYGAFLYLNFFVVPRLFCNKDVLWNGVRTALLFSVTGFMFGATNVMLKHYVYQIQSIEATLLELYGTGFLFAGFWFVVFGFYTITKYSIMYMIDKSNQMAAKNSFIRKEGVVAFLIWVSLLLLMIATDTITLFTLFWIVLVPPGIMLYLLSFYLLIPESLQKQKPFRSYFSKMALILAALFLPVAGFVWVILEDGPPSVMLSIINTAFQLLVTMPVSWTLYKRYKKDTEEITTLKRELVQSNAGIDFLRSQINPHFLFNALNTLYGTALEEKAERTGEGIQKLGDMMRFMLQENMQEKIGLTREVEYMNNYINLQKLRTDASPGISIKADIADDVEGLQIAPMLLIPFVENAFKHGISFREPSFITISLKRIANTLHFEVRNSTHAKMQNDPEKYNTGIGMNNVQQRLELLYPGKHQLQVNNAGNEFVVSLTIQLT